LVLLPQQILVVAEEAVGLAGVMAQAAQAAAVLSLSNT
jgi:hypothetical protein